jgi:hypothetical protein
MTRLRQGLADLGRGRYLTSVALIPVLPSSGQAITQAPVPAADPTPSSLVLSSYVNNNLPDWRGVCGECGIRPEQHVAYTFVPGSNHVPSRLGLNFDVAPTGWKSPIPVCS